MGLAGRAEPSEGWKASPPQPPSLLPTDVPATWRVRHAQSRAGTVEAPQTDHITALRSQGSELGKPERREAPCCPLSRRNKGGVSAPASTLGEDPQGPRGPCWPAQSPRPSTSCKAVVGSLARAEQGLPGPARLQ